MKPPRFHRRDQAGGGSSFPLHVTDAADSASPMMVGGLQSKLEPADAGADGEDVEVSGVKGGM